MSHLLQMRGLKPITILCLLIVLWYKSHLLQMRGLKPIGFRLLEASRKSHLLQMRGLKLVSLALLELVDAVASFTDAWIETSHFKDILKVQACRIFYRCVD